MPYISVHVDSCDVLREMDDEDLKQEIDRREARKAPVGTAAVCDADVLESVYLHFRRSGDAPDCLREYIYRQIGRIL